MKKLILAGMLMAGTAQADEVTVCTSFPDADRKFTFGQGWGVWSYNDQVGRPVTHDFVCRGTDDGNTCVKLSDHIEDIFFRDGGFVHIIVFDKSGTPLVRSRIAVECEAI